jgi:hypothetical protein
MLTNAKERPVIAVILNNTRRLGVRLLSANRGVAVEDFEVADGWQS